MPHVRRNRSCGPLVSRPRPGPLQGHWSRTAHFPPTLYRQFEAPQSPHPPRLAPNPILHHQPFTGNLEPHNPRIPPGWHPTLSYITPQVPWNPPPSLKSHDGSQSSLPGPRHLSCPNRPLRLLQHLPRCRLLCHRPCPRHLRPSTSVVALVFSPVFLLPFSAGSSFLTEELAEFGEPIQVERKDEKVERKDEKVERKDEKVERKDEKEQRVPSPSAGSFPPSVVVVCALVPASSPTFSSFLSTWIGSPNSANSSVLLSPSVSTSIGFPNSSTPFPQFTPFRSFDSVLTLIGPSNFASQCSLDSSFILAPRCCHLAPCFQRVLILPCSLRVLTLRLNTGGRLFRPPQHTPPPRGFRPMTRPHVPPL
jgi:hypothetical protein